MPTPKKWHVFIGHASEDLALAAALARELKRLGWKVFLAAQDIAGEVGSVGWSSALDDALDRSNVLLVVATQAAAKSGWVEYEWRTFHSALMGNRELGAIIPLCAGGRTRAELERTLQYYQGVTLAGVELTAEAVREVDTLVRAHVESPRLLQRWSIRYHNVTTPDLGFLEHKTGFEDMKYIGIDVRWPDEVERHIEKYTEDARSFSDLTYRVYTQDQLAWKGRLADGVRALALALAGPNAPNPRVARKAFEFYLTSYAIGVFRAVAGVSYVGWEPLPSHRILSNGRMPRSGPFRGGMITRTRLNKEELVGWLPAKVIASNRLSVDVIVPVGAVKRACWLQAAESRLDWEQYVSGDDFWIYVVPQLADEVAGGATVALEEVVVAARIERHHDAYAFDAESYEQINWCSPPSDDWKSFEGRLRSSLRERPPRSNDAERAALTEVLGLGYLLSAFSGFEPLMPGLVAELKSSEAAADERLKEVRRNDGA